MEYKTEPLAWENNENTILQKDQHGNYQNVAYYDSDDGLILGPNDPTQTIITQVPINCFKPQPFSDFDERTLDPKWLFTGTGSANLGLADSCAILGTGNTLNSVAEMSMTNVPMYFVNGQRVYFYLTTIPNGNLELEFGIKKDENNLIRFKRVEDNTASSYSSETRASGVSSSYSSVAPGDSVRRLFCIQLEANAAKFYTSTSMGVLELKAAHTTQMPTGKGYVYIKIKNRYAAHRQVDVDFVWPSRIR